MKHATQSLAAAALLAMAGSASALTVNVGGLDLTTGATFGVASVYENVITAAGQTLAGFGEVTQINGVSLTELCAGCELTYRFGGFEATSLSPTGVTFDGGWVNFYLGFGGDNDFNPFASAGSAADLAAATNGSLFLTLAGHQIDAAGNTFAGIGRDIGTTTPVGFGAGLLDVDNTGALNGNTAGAGALANTFFDTNGIAATFGGAADFQLGASFSSALLPHPGECPSGAACVAGSVDIRGNVAAIPEPETYALMLAGLGVVGFIARRRKRG
jgi:hypothetical protein